MVSLTTPETPFTSRRSFPSLTDAVRKAYEKPCSGTRLIRAPPAADSAGVSPGGIAVAIVVGYSCGRRVVGITVVLGSVFSLFAGVVVMRRAEHLAPRPR